jgi:hypothetical protein
MELEILKAMNISSKFDKNTLETLKRIRSSISFKILENAKILGELTPKNIYFGTVLTFQNESFLQDFGKMINGVGSVDEITENIEPLSKISLLSSLSNIMAEIVLGAHAFSLERDDDFIILTDLHGSIENDVELKEILRRTKILF